MPSKNRITINLSEEELLEMATISSKSHVSLAWIGRQAIREFLAKYRDAPPDFPVYRADGSDTKRHEGTIGRE